MAKDTYRLNIYENLKASPLFDDEVILTLINAMLEHYPAYFERLRQDLSAQNEEGIREVCHKINGTLRIIIAKGGDFHVFLEEIKAIGSASPLELERKKSDLKAYYEVLMLELKECQQLFSNLS